MVTNAKESSEIAKFRKKLESKIEMEKKKITIESIEKSKRAIYNWIDHHFNERILLKTKNVRLFDENKHPAPLKSKKILKLASNLKTDKLKPNQPIKFKATKI